VSINQTVLAGNFGPEAPVGFPVPADAVGFLDLSRNSEIDNIDYVNILSETGVNLLDSFANLSPTLADNGGHGQRHPRTHKPLHGSPVIDATAAVDSSIGTQDQGYRSRGFDFNPGGNRFDMGAVELQSGQ
jgi:hypothetical protein